MAAALVLLLAAVGAIAYRAFVDSGAAPRQDVAQGPDAAPSAPTAHEIELAAAMGIRVPSWAEPIALRPDPRVVTDATARARVEATGLAWKVRDSGSRVVLLLVPPGEYMRGAPPSDRDAEPNELPAHRVRVAEPFYLGETELTVAQWRRFVDETGHPTDAENRGHSWSVGSDGEWVSSAGANWRTPFPRVKFARPAEDWPVVHLSWNDAHVFCEHYGLRLPREAEWEYACRAGTTATRWWGDDAASGRGKGNVADRAARARFRTWTTFDFDDGHALLSAVGHFAANPWGFHDMLGNAWEWCSTPYEESYARLAQREPVDASEGEGGLAGFRALRGGAWNAAPAFVRASYRAFDVPTYSDDNLGVRVARTP